VQEIEGHLAPQHLQGLAEVVEEDIEIAEDVESEEDSDEEESDLPSGEHSAEDIPQE